MATQVLDPTRDSAVYAQLKVPGVKYALGLDLGTNCGVALRIITRKPGLPLELGQLYLGQWRLDSGPNDSSPIRFVRLRTFLNDIRPSIIFYEDVKFVGVNEGVAKGSLKAIVARMAPSMELIGAFRATLTTWGEENGVPTQGFGIGEIKRHATEKGNSGKPAMIEACNRKFGTKFSTTDYEAAGLDNIADAAHALDLGLSLYGSGL